MIGTSSVDHEHVVHFYDDEDALSESAATFLGRALVEGEPALIVATEPRWRAVLGQLGARGLDAARARAEGELVVLDARETIEKLLVGGSPDRTAFEATLGAAVAAPLAARPAARLCAYGETVDLLWKEGRRDAAIELEALWNELAQKHAFSLLCAYDMASFRGDPSDIERVCTVHARVVDGGNRSSAIVRALARALSSRVETERARQVLEQERARAEARNSRLMQVTAAIAEAVTAEQVLEAVVDKVAAALGASSAALWRFDGASRCIVMARSLGYSQAAANAFATAPLDAKRRFPALDAISERRAIWIESQQELFELYPELTRAATPDRRYRICCVPIEAQGEVLGSLGLTFEHGDELVEDERNFVSMVARYAGQALERLRLLEAERKNRAQAELLYELAGSVIAAGSLEEVLRAALEGLERALGTSRSAILVFDADGLLRFKDWRGLSDAYRGAVEGHCPWPRDVRAPEPVIVPDALGDPALAAYRELFRAENIGALGFFPLVDSGRLIGKFMVYYADPRELSAAEIGVAVTIANHLAAAIARFTALAELRNTVRFNETFTGVLGHDLRNPLGAIMTAAQLALMRTESERVSKPLSRILASGQRMARMIDQLLDFTRVRLGSGIPLEPKSFDLLPVLEQAMGELDDAYPDSSLRVSHSGDSVGVWDEDRLCQVFSNLVANALQHGEPGHEVNVSIDGTDGAEVVIELHNQGVIPDEVLARLFEPMSGGERRRANSRGLGLGLYISQRIIEAHGGRIEVRSRASEGTRFRVFLPRNARSREKIGE